MTNNHLRINRILDILENNHPHAKISLNYSNNWELLVSVILSAQCTDIKVNQVTSKLFPKFRSHPEEQSDEGSSETIEINNFASAPLSELEQDIKSTGFYHNKAKNIQNAAKIILEKFNGKIPDTMDNILKLPGVARKTGNVVLGNAYGVVAGIAVDTHVLRISQRLRLVDLDKVGGKKPILAPSSLREPHSAARGNLALDYYKDAKPEKIEKELMKIIPRKDWFKFTYQVIDHGRSICKAQNPKCEICPLNKLCPAFRI